MKIKSIILVVLLLLVVLCGYSWWSAGATLQQSLVNNRTPLLQRDTDSFKFWRGDPAYRNWLSSESKTSDVLTYDGENRFAYVIRCTNPLYSGNTDNIQFGTIDGPRIGPIWICMQGARFCSVDFSEDSVQVGVATEENPTQELYSAIVPWSKIESGTGTGRLEDYFQK